MPPVTENEQSLSLQVSEAGDEVVMEVAGELDPHTAEQLSAALKPFTDRDDLQRVVLDLSSLGFIDSSGLRAILTADDALRSRGARLTLRSPSEAVRRLLEITDLLNHLEVE